MIACVSSLPLDATSSVPDAVRAIALYDLLHHGRFADFASFERTILESLGSASPSTGLSTKGLSSPDDGTSSRTWGSILAFGAACHEKCGTCEFGIHHIVWSFRS